MVKEIIMEPGRTFSEFSLLTGETTSETTLENISLDTKLGELELSIPLLSAAMTSVTGFDMASALGRAGGLGVLPVNLPLEEQVNIVKRVKQIDLSFVEEPLTVNEKTSIDDTIRIIEKRGYSTVPVVDRFHNFRGMFTLEHYWGLKIGKNEPVTKAMIPYKPNATQGLIEQVIKNKTISIDEAKKYFAQEGNGKYLVVVDDQNRLIKMAFKQDVEQVKVAAAISTRDGWKERVEALKEAGVDMIVVDTSDAYSTFAKEVIEQYKGMDLSIPLCVGNIITGDGAKYLINAGADVIKVGMSSGSICTTQRVKATGRAPVSALLEVIEVRDQISKINNKYVPVIMDGGVSSSADMIIALSMADALMQGGYFNQFYEAAGPKLDRHKKPTNIEEEICYVETWGEGSERARNLDRYGHRNRSTFFAEGVEGTKPYAGRLKPRLKRDITIIKTALSNVGVQNLREYRANAVLELNSPHTSLVVSTTHHVDEKK